ncbi:AbrB/MazE/SpoVT family DNA-binding domain-containing protein [Xylophilus sp.]|uniref:AbrB/MazE/SpoVT family DNA-binding domain-containing protein n=1 Tax=Xylophilus sp. TaxID=2653893 RepID=UPI002D80E616|nr:AbrB/MazE/SpoVT family DNA-binding domain-containing protein [Xylophilus sp.]
MPAAATTIRLSSKGQVVLPHSIRRAHQWHAGTEFAVQETPEGLLLRPLGPGADAGLRVEDVAGCLKPRRPGAVSLADMDAAVAREARARRAQGRY